PLDSNGVDDLDGGAVEGQTTPEEVASSALIVKNYPLLTKDLARLITLASIARNILVAGPSAQDLAASRSVRIEDSVFALISLCVRVTGRGFDSGGNGNGTKDDERKWQGVVNEFKRLLATCLQVLNNLVAQNERRKLMLWVSLFDSPAEGSEGDGNGNGEMGGGWNLDRRLIEGLRDDPVVNGSWAEGEGREEVEMEVGRDGVPKVIRRFQDGLMAHMKRLEERRMLTGRTVNNLASTNTHLRESETPTLDKEQLSSSPFLLYIGKVGMDIKKELLDAGRPAGATEIAAECKRRWQTMSREEQRNWHEYYTQLLASYRDEVEARDPAVEGMNVASEAVKHDSSAVGLAQTIEQVQSDLRALQLAYPDKADLSEAANESVKDIPQGLSKNYWNWLVGLDKKQTMPGNGDGPVQRPIRADNTAPTAEDYRVTYSAKYGAAILQQGKEDLLRRLEPDRLRTSRSRRARTRSPPPPPPSTTPLPPRSGSQPVPEPPDAPLCLASEDDVDSREPLSAASAASSEEDGSEYDDPVPGDDGRGLLTDVPLILGPTEIEVLPMIVQSGIVAPLPGQPGYGETPEENEALRSMHALRCHLLLAQDNGRNLVRELLIFVAAWDLREEELYFQLMTQVLEAVLVNGL
ncbi:MAG: high mobility group box domain-containing protein, partial [Terriglobus roseus]|nr:high mobility group box domain-containing protein [Terriglobus roseus]